jgi:glucosamine--fructose-6-phosphate aminotransferase (isomerizing)
LGGRLIIDPYIADILAQPAASREALRNYSPGRLHIIHERLQRGDFDRILLSGMGSSYNAAYPALIQLSSQPIPVQLINAAELLHTLNGMIGPRSLLWLNSQSGRSAELVNLLERIKTAPPACTLTFVNDLTSPMAKHADACLPIHAGPEATVSTKTYVNMLAVNLLAAIQLTNGDLASAIRETHAAVEAMETYLSDWEARVRELDSLLGDFEQLFLIGRGSSMSAVWNGSLINKEAAKCAFEGMNAADFRHGPLELVSEGFAALIFAGSAQTSALNRDLARDILSYGGKVMWVDSSPDPEISTLLLPVTSELTRPLVEILPMQMLTLVMANRKGLQAGQFRYVSKVTDRE